MFMFGRKEERPAAAAHARWAMRPSGPRPCPAASVVVSRRGVADVSCRVRGVSPPAPAPPPAPQLLVPTSRDRFPFSLHATTLHKRKQYEARSLWLRGAIDCYMPRARGSRHNMIMGGACETRAVRAADALSTDVPEEACRLALGVVGCGCGGPSR